jgi:hypothetical protein
VAEPEVHDIALKHYGPLTEVSPTFLDGMLRRMAVSYHKYGTVENNCGPGGNIDAIKCALQRIEKTIETGNLEFLMDAANFCMMRFMWPKEGEYFRATDSDESPGLTTVAGDVVTGTKPAPPIFAQRKRHEGD